MSLAWKAVDLVYAILLSYFVILNAKTDTWLCVDRNCIDTISIVKSKRDHVQTSPSYLKFKTNQVIRVIAKPSDESAKVWYGKIDDQKGYFEVDAVKVTTVFHKSLLHEFETDELVAMQQSGNEPEDIPKKEESVAEGDNDKEATDISYISGSSTDKESTKEEPPDKKNEVPKNDPSTETKDDLGSQADRLVMQHKKHQEIRNNFLKRRMEKLLQDKREVEAAIGQSGRLQPSPVMVEPTNPRWRKPPALSDLHDADIYSMASDSVGHSSTLESAVHTSQIHDSSSADNEAIPLSTNSITHRQQRRIHSGINLVYSPRYFYGDGVSLVTNRFPSHLSQPNTKSEVDQSMSITRQPTDLKTEYSSRMKTGKVANIDGCQCRKYLYGDYRLTNFALSSIVTATRLKTTKLQSQEKSIETVSVFERSGRYQPDANANARDLFIGDSRKTAASEVFMRAALKYQFKAKYDEVSFKSCNAADKTYLTNDNKQTQDHVSFAWRPYHLSDKHCSVWEMFLFSRFHSNSAGRVATKECSTESEKINEIATMEKNIGGDTQRKSDGTLKAASGFMLDSEIERTIEESDKPLDAIRYMDESLDTDMQNLRSEQGTRANKRLHHVHSYTEKGMPEKSLSKEKLKCPNPVAKYDNTPSCDLYSYILNKPFSEIETEVHTKHVVLKVERAEFSHQRSVLSPYPKYENASTFCPFYLMSPNSLCEIDPEFRTEGAVNVVEKETSEVHCPERAEVSRQKSVLTLYPKYENASPFCLFYLMSPNSVCKIDPGEYWTEGAVNVVERETSEIHCPERAEVSRRKSVLTLYPKYENASTFCPFYLMSPNSLCEIDPEYQTEGAVNVVEKETSEVHCHERAEVSRQKSVLTSFPEYENASTFCLFYEKPKYTKFVEAPLHKMAIPELPAEYKKTNRFVAEYDQIRHLDKSSFSNLHFSNKVFENYYSTVFPYSSLQNYGICEIVTESYEKDTTLTDDRPIIPQSDFPDKSNQIEGDYLYKSDILQKQLWSGGPSVRTFPEEQDSCLSPERSSVHYKPFNKCQNNLPMHCPIYGNITSCLFQESRDFNVCKVEDQKALNNKVCIATEQWEVTKRHTSEHREKPIILDDDEVEPISPEDRLHSGKTVIINASTFDVNYRSLSEEEQFHSGPCHHYNVSLESPSSTDSLCQIFLVDYRTKCYLGIRIVGSETRRTLNESTDAEDVAKMHYVSQGDSKFQTGTRRTRTYRAVTASTGENCSYCSLYGIISKTSPIDRISFPVMQTANSVEYKTPHIIDNICPIHEANISRTICLESDTLEDQYVRVTNIEQVNIRVFDWRSNFTETSSFLFHNKTNLRECPLTNNVCERHLDHLRESFCENCQEIRAEKPYGARKPFHGFKKKAPILNYGTCPLNTTMSFQQEKTSGLLTGEFDQHSSLWLYKTNQAGIVNRVQPVESYFVNKTRYPSDLLDPINTTRYYHVSDVCEIAEIFTLKKPAQRKVCKEFKLKYEEDNQRCMDSELRKYGSLIDASHAIPGIKEPGVNGDKLQDDGKLTDLSGVTVDDLSKPVQDQETHVRVKTGGPVKDNDLKNQPDTESEAERDSEGPKKDEQQKISQPDTTASEGAQQKKDPELKSDENEASRKEMQEKKHQEIRSNFLKRRVQTQVQEDVEVDELNKLLQRQGGKTEASTLPEEQPAPSILPSSSLQVPSQYEQPVLPKTSHFPNVRLESEYDAILHPTEPVKPSQTESAKVKLSATTPLDVSSTQSQSEIHVSLKEKPNFLTESTIKSSDPMQVFTSTQQIQSEHAPHSSSRPGISLPLSSSYGFGLATAGGQDGLESSILSVESTASLSTTHTPRLSDMHAAESSTHGRTSDDVSRTEQLHTPTSDSSHLSNLDKEPSNLVEPSPGQRIPRMLPTVTPNMPYGGGLENVQSVHSSIAVSKSILDPTFDDGDSKATEGGDDDTQGADDNLIEPATPLDELDLEESTNQDELETDSSSNIEDYRIKQAVDDHGKKPQPLQDKKKKRAAEQVANLDDGYSDSDSKIPGDGESQIKLKQQPNIDSSRAERLRFSNTIRADEKSEGVDIVLDGVGKTTGEKQSPASSILYDSFKNFTLTDAVIDFSASANASEIMTNETLEPIAKDESDPVAESEKSQSENKVDDEQTMDESDGWKESELDDEGEDENYPEGEGYSDEEEETDDDLSEEQEDDETEDDEDGESDLFYQDSVVIPDTEEEHQTRDHGEIDELTGKEGENSSHLNDVKADDNKVDIIDDKRSESKDDAGQELASGAAEKVKLTEREVQPSVIKSDPQNTKINKLPAHEDRLSKEPEINQKSDVQPSHDSVAKTDPIESKLSETKEQDLTAEKTEDKQEYPADYNKQSIEIKPTATVKEESDSTTPKTTYEDGYTIIEGVDATTTMIGYGTTLYDTPDGSVIIETSTTNTPVISNTAPGRTDSSTAQLQSTQSFEEMPPLQSTIVTSTEISPTPTQQMPQTVSPTGHLDKPVAPMTEGGTELPQPEMKDGGKSEKVEPTKIDSKPTQKQSAPEPAVIQSPDSPPHPTDDIKKKLGSTPQEQEQQLGSTPQQQEHSPEQNVVIPQKSSPEQPVVKSQQPEDVHKQPEFSTEKSETTPEKSVNTTQKSAPQQPDVTPDKVVTPQQPDVTPDKVVAPQQPEVTPGKVVTPQQPEVTPDKVVTPQQPEVTPDTVVPAHQPEVTRDKVVTPQQPEVTPDNVITPQQPEVTSDNVVSPHHLDDIHQHPGSVPPQQSEIPDKVVTQPQHADIQPEIGSIPQKPEMSPEKPIITPQQPDGDQQNQPEFPPQQSETVPEQHVGGTPQEFDGTEQQPGSTSQQPKIVPEQPIVPAQKPGDIEQELRSTPQLSKPLPGEVNQQQSEYAQQESGSTLQQSETDQLSAPRQPDVSQQQYASTADQLETAREHVNPQESNSIHQEAEFAQQQNENVVPPRDPASHTPENYSPPNPESDLHQSQTAPEQPVVTPQPDIQNEPVNVPQEPDTAPDQPSGILHHPDGSHHPDAAPEQPQYAPEDAEGSAHSGGTTYQPESVTNQPDSNQYQETTQQQSELVPELPDANLDQSHGTQDQFQSDTSPEPHDSSQPAFTSESADSVARPPDDLSENSEQPIFTSGSAESVQQQSGPSENSEQYNVTTESESKPDMDVIKGSMQDPLANIPSPDASGNSDPYVTEFMSRKVLETEHPEGHVEGSHHNQQPDVRESVTTETPYAEYEMQPPVDNGQYIETTPTPIPEFGDQPSTNDPLDNMEGYGNTEKPNEERPPQDTVTSDDVQNVEDLIPDELNPDLDPDFVGKQQGSFWTEQPKAQPDAQKKSLLQQLRDVIKQVDDSLEGFYIMLPSAIKEMLSHEPLGVTPHRATLMILVTLLATIIITLATACCGRKTGLDKKIAAERNDAVNKLYIISKERETLEEEIEKTKAEVAKYKEGISGFDEQIKSLEENVSLLEKQKEELEESRDGAVAEGNSYMDKLSEVEENYNQLKEDLVTSQGMCETLQTDLTSHKKNLQGKEKQNKKLKDKIAELETKLPALTEELERVQQSKDDLLNESEGWKDRVDDLTEQLQTAQEERTSYEEVMTFKDKEIEVLKDYYMQLKALQDQLDSSNVEGGDAEADGVKDKFQDIVNIAATNAKLKTTEEERDLIKQRHDIEVESRKDLEEQVNKLQIEVDSLRVGHKHAEEQSKEATTKLNVLAAYFKDKELHLQKELGVQQLTQKQKDTALASAGVRVQEAEEGRTAHRQQVDDLTKEIQRLEQEYSKQISANEKKAHDNWLAARQAERNLKEAKNEAALLRQRLVEMERKHELELLNTASLIRPVPTTAMPTGMPPTSVDAGNGPSPENIHPDAFPPRMREELPLDRRPMPPYMRDRPPPPQMMDGPYPDMRNTPPMRRPPSDNRIPHPMDMRSPPPRFRRTPPTGVDPYRRSPGFRRSPPPSFQRSEHPSSGHSPELAYRQRRSPSPRGRSPSPRSHSPHMYRHRSASPSPRRRRSPYRNRSPSETPPSSRSTSPEDYRDRISRSPSPSPRYRNRSPSPDERHHRGPPPPARRSVSPERVRSPPNMWPPRAGPMPPGGPRYPYRMPTPGNRGPPPPVGYRPNSRPLYDPNQQPIHMDDPPRTSSPDDGPQSRV